MERGNLARWLLLAVGIFLLITFGGNWFGGGSKEKQPTSGDVLQMQAPVGQRPPEQLCDLWGDRFSAQLSTRGASLKRFTLTTSKYKKDGKQILVTTTPDQEFYQPFRFHFSNGCC